MSEASERGKSYEVKVQKLTARKLGLEVKRDSRSGAGAFHKEDIRDRYGELPLSIEVKNQATLKLKEWFRDAADKASVGQAPVVVFPMDEDDLAVIRYGDLLNIVKEMFDWRVTAEDLQKPLPAPAEIVESKLAGLPHPIVKDAAGVAEQVKALPARNYCPNGHAVPDGRGKCLAKYCQFSATYKKPKDKR